jgi:fatty acid desaturase
VTGEQWDDYRKKLLPAYGRIWTDIGIIWIMIAAGIAVITRLAFPFDYLAMPVAAVWTGFWIHAYVNFFHEAAHFNLSPSRRRNDQLATWLFTPFCALDIRLYRRSHWQHHLHLGTQEDTEISYRSPLSLRTLLFTLCGFHAAMRLQRYFRMPEAAEDEPSARAASFRALLLFGLCQAAIALGLACLASLPAAITWIAGQMLVYPFWAMLRQILEHRAQKTQAGDGQVGYSPTNRLFGSGLLSRYFGAAGFNRHLLHHWDPQISYSRFEDMEQFLGHTQFAPVMDASRSGYRHTFRKLFHE